MVVWRRKSEVRECPLVKWGEEDRERKTHGETARGREAEEERWTDRQRQKEIQSERKRE